MSEREFQTRQNTKGSSEPIERESVPEHRSSPLDAKIGRGALSNPRNRYDSLHSETFTDDWWLPEEDSDRVKTQTFVDAGKTIISTNKSPDIPFDQSINPYRGCEHGCIYCYARPTHAYWDFSPGMDFETKIITKPNAASLLRKSFLKEGYQCKVVSIGANTDPYQPLEAKLKTTREILEVLAKHKHPFSLITKSSLVVRDLDILSKMAQQNLCSVAVSVTTLNDDLKRQLEPRTANGKARLKTIETLASAGVPVTMMVAPVIPFINDHEIETILERGKQAGARSTNMILLRLPLEVSPLFREWLEHHYPDKAKHVMSLIRSARNGSDYESKFHTRMVGEGDYALTIRKRFDIAARKLGFGITKRIELDVTQFRRGYDQLSLF